MRFDHDETVQTDPSLLLAKSGDTTGANSGGKLAFGRESPAIEGTAFCSYTDGAVFLFGLCATALVIRNRVTCSKRSSSGDGAGFEPALFDKQGARMLAAFTARERA
jgi:hypothetical protein